jgi:hypothetical protein
MLLTSETSILKTLKTLKIPFLGIFNAISARYSHMNATWKDAHILSRMSDNALSDIGLYREDDLERGRHNWR